MGLNDFEMSQDEMNGPPDEAWSTRVRLRRCVKCREVLTPQTWHDQFAELCESCFEEARRLI